MTRRGIVFYLHVHQPFRVRKYSIFDTAQKHDYFSESDASDRNNERVFRKVLEKSYMPMNQLLEKLLREYPDFKVSLSITGTFIEQALRWAPDILESFRRLVASGRVEIVGETYYHSLAFFYSREEFERQVKMHREKIEELFGTTPQVFRNTELAYNNDLGVWADKRGYKAILAEGWDPVLAGRSANFVYRPPAAQRTKLLLKNYKLSDDIAFRFSDKDWSKWPLNTDEYIEWINTSLESADIVNLFMDYETFGEHQWKDTGIFTFFEQFVAQWLKNEDRTFYTTSEAADTFDAVDEVSMPQTVTWADTERDLTAWLGNAMQTEALRYIYALEQDILLTNDEELLADWRKLQTSDHVYYMCTKWFSDGDVHAYFSPYESPYDAFLYFMNALRDVRYRLMAYHHGGIHG